MTWFRRKGKMRSGLAVARAEREKSEVRLEDAQRNVIRPLAELRERNHVGDLLESLIQRRVEDQRR